MKVRNARKGSHSLGFSDEPHPSAVVYGGERFSVDVELELPRGRVADPNGLRSFVAREPGELSPCEPSSAGNVVHDLQVGRIARDSAEQPVAKRLSFADVAADHQGVEREAGVAKPAKAIVPIADAADVLGQ
jgi:hypothetical protein